MLLEALALITKHRGQLRCPSAMSGYRKRVFFQNVEDAQTERMQETGQEDRPPGMTLSEDTSTHIGQRTKMEEAVLTRVGVG